MVPERAVYCPGTEHRAGPKDDRQLPKGGDGKDSEVPAGRESGNQTAQQKRPGVIPASQSARLPGGRLEGTALSKKKARIATGFFLLPGRDLRCLHPGAFPDQRRPFLSGPFQSADQAFLALLRAKIRPPSPAPSRNKVDGSGTGLPTTMASSTFRMSKAQ
jgi:hypothetical protein